MKLLHLFFIILFLTPASRASELEFFIYRAAAPLDWNSPGALLKTTLNNMFMKVGDATYPHSISHINIGLKCDSEPMLYRGMAATKSNFSYLWDFLIQGQALDSLLVPVRGRYYTEDEILHWLPLLKKTGHVRSLKFLLSNSQCARLQNYLKSYEALGLHRIYGGLRSEPLQGQGGGCSAFAMSFLQVLGLDIDRLFPAWRRHLLVPRNLLSSQTRSASIGLAGYLLKGETGQWASDPQDAVPLSFWDPELMFQWVDSIFKSKKTPQNLSFQKDPSTDYKIVLWNLRHEPLPKSEIFNLPKASLEKTAKYHIDQVERLLSDEEIANSSPKKCRLFSVCD
jgi:hypothetical protein